MSEWKEAILALFEQYMGEIATEDETISIQARNFITDHWGNCIKSCVRLRLQSALAVFLYQQKKQHYQS